MSVSSPSASLVADAGGPIPLDDPHVSTPMLEPRIHPKPPATSPPADLEPAPAFRRPKPCRLLPSLFSHRPPTLSFEYPAFLGIKRDPHSDELDTLDPASAMIPKFKIFNSHEYNCVRNAFLRMGFQREEDPDSETANAIWSRHLKEDGYMRLNPYQKVNHFPGSWVLGRKDALSRNLARMRREFGEHYNISTTTYILPADRPKLKRDMEEEPKSIWILKPPAGSCGRGIRLVSKAADSAMPNPTKKLIAQKYVKHPFLIDGRKFDLRIYVLVTSYDPLRVYLFHQGLVRFCTERYSLSSKNLKNRLGHLTNYSLNKKSEAFDKNTDATKDGEGSKWSLQALLRFFRDNGIDDNKVMANICDVIIKTLISGESEIASLCNRYFRNRTVGMASSSCFEVLGFDILLDKNLKAWLIEVNISPSLSSSSPLDKKIKNMLMTDVFHLVGFVPYDPRKLGREMERKKMDRLLGRSRGFAGSLHRNVRQLTNLSLKDLTPWELSVLCETEDEMSRCGNFTRIFPSLSTGYYNAFFQTQRLNNYLLDMWLHKWRPAHGLEGLAAAVQAKNRALSSPQEAISTLFSGRGRAGSVDSTSAWSSSDGYSSGRRGSVDSTSLSRDSYGSSSRGVRRGGRSRSVAPASRARGRDRPPAPRRARAPSATRTPTSSRTRRTSTSGGRRPRAGAGAGTRVPADRRRRGVPVDAWSDSDSYYSSDSDYTSPTADYSSDASDIVGPPPPRSSGRTPRRTTSSTTASTVSSSRRRTTTTPGKSPRSPPSASRAALFGGSGSASGSRRSRGRRPAVSDDSGSDSAPDDVAATHPLLSGVTRRRSSSTARRSTGAARGSATTGGSRRFDDKRRMGARHGSSGTTPVKSHSTRNLRRSASSQPLSRTRSGRVGGGSSRMVGTHV